MGVDPPPHSTARLPSAIGLVYTALVLLICGFFITFMLPLANPAPYTDDWMYIGVAGFGIRSLVRWSLEPHNEHFIPLMKLSQYATLRIANFDFRPLIGISALLATLASFAAFSVARAYRGRESLGDLFFPFVLLNSAFNVFAWGFSAQFGTAIAEAFIFLFFFSVGLARRNALLIALAYLTLLTLGLTGLNGMVVAVVTSILMLIASLLAREAVMRRQVAIASGMIGLLLVTVYIATRVPATMPLQQLDPALFANWIYHLLVSSLVIRAEPGGWWHATLLGALAVAALTICAFTAWSLLRRRSVQLMDSAVQSLFIGFAALVFVITLGRASLGAWDPGLELHYGYLTTPLPILGWIIVSRALPRLPALACGFVLVVLYGDAFWAGSQWRFGYLQSKRVEFEDMDRLIRSDAPPTEITRLYMREIYWRDTPELRQLLESSIQQYRGVIKRY